MSWTNLSLGHNWPADEWPEYIEVDHDDGCGAGPRRYVPERTCRMTFDDVSSSLYSGPMRPWAKCGACVPREFSGPYNYCPCCGARVVGER